ncbi:MAG: site-specific integrase [Desulfobulbaceae bacterium]|nr:site-specific integrase [Desulfobulbaceae bacterium]
MKRYRIGKKTGVYGRDSSTRRVNGKPDVCYDITFKVNGQKKWEKVGWKSEGYSPAMAVELRANRVKSTRHGEEVKTASEIKAHRLKHNKPLEAIKHAYFDSEHGKAIKGRKIDLNRYELHLTFLSKKRTPELTALDIERIKRNMKGKAPATIKHSLRLLSRLVNYGVKHHLCPPLQFTIEVPKVNNQVTEYLTDEEARRYLAVLDSWPRQDIARMVRIAWLTGMRRGEIFKLRSEHLDFTMNLITLVDPKGGRDETIPLTAPVREILKVQLDYLKKRDEHRERRYLNTSKPAPEWEDSGYVFPGIGGQQRKYCSAINKIKQQAKLPKSFRPFHGLRHHMAVTLASSGEYTLDMIGELLTHKDSAVTRRYAKFLPEAMQKSADRAADLLTRQTETVEIVQLHEVSE